MSTFWTPCWSGSASVVLMKAMKAKGASNPSVIKTGMNGFLECMVTLHPFGVATGRHVPETVWAANRKDQILCPRSIGSQSVSSRRPSSPDFPRRNHSPAVQVLLPLDPRPLYVQNDVWRFTHGYQLVHRAPTTRKSAVGKRRKNKESRGDQGAPRVHRSSRATKAARALWETRVESGLRLQKRAVTEMNVFVDTSVWSLAFRRDARPGSEVGLILQELLQGFHGPKAKGRIIRSFSLLPVISPEIDDHIDAAGLRNTCRRKGIQVGTIDALIAQLCIRHGLQLLTPDEDFQHMAKHTPLSVLAS